MKKAIKAGTETKNGAVTYELPCRYSTKTMTLRVDPKLRVVGRMPDGCSVKTLAYAAYRYLRICPDLREPLVLEADFFDSKYRGRIKSRWRLIRAAGWSLALPGGRVTIFLRVKQGEIVLRGLWLRKREPRWTKRKIKKAHEKSANHKPELEKDSICGCFACGRIFSPKEIRNWVIAPTPIDYRGTALCPYCEIDAVLGESAGYPLTQEFLWEMNKYWFCGTMEIIKEPKPRIYITVKDGAVTSVRKSVRP